MLHERNKGSEQHKGKEIYIYAFGIIRLIPKVTYIAFKVYILSVVLAFSRNSLGLEPCSTVIATFLGNYLQGCDLFCIFRPEKYDSRWLLHDD